MKKDFKYINPDNEDNQQSELSIFDENILQEELEGYLYDEVALTTKDKAKLKSLKKDIQIIDDRVVKTSRLTKKDYKIDYKHELNKQQLVAVAITKKPLLVVAGAGTGKTRTIVYKVAYLIENGIPATNILLLTFTRRAAKGMIDKVYNLLNQKRQISTVFGGTFHSFAARILRLYGKLIGLPDFTILDTQDMSDVVDLVRKENGFVKKGDIPFPKKNTIQEIISRSKNLEKPIPEVINVYFEDKIPAQYIEDIEKIADYANKYKKEHNMLDYDDLMDVLCHHLKTNEVFLQRIRQRFSYVLVDEYQDTNSKQREILELIVGGRDCVTVVGDDSQSIYGFRGANYENILRFYESFPHCVSVKIEENYRSSQELLNFTNQIISSNQMSFHKQLYSSFKTGATPVAYQALDSLKEAEYIARKLIQVKSTSTLNFSDFAVLTRSSWHSTYTQVEFVKNHIPFIVVGGIKFHEKRHVKDVIAFLKLTVNPFDTVAWHRILSLIEGVGEVRATEIVKTIIERNGEINFSKFSQQKYYEHLTIYEKFYNQIKDKEMAPIEVVKRILGFYEDILANIESDYEARLIDLQTLEDLAIEYKGMKSFLADFSLDPPNRYQGDTAILDENYKDVVVISTIHSAKGLEWNTVFLPFLVEGAFPSFKSMRSLEDLEEERRVFYVAASRAKENLFLTLSQFTSLDDQGFSKPSRFIAEVGMDKFMIDKTYQ